VPCRMGTASLLITRTRNRYIAAKQAKREILGLASAVMVTVAGIAGLGWIGVGVSGSAELRVWTHQGVSVTAREALIPDMAAELEKPGLGNKTQKAPKVVKNYRK
jgi:hypothetical protein